MSVCSQHREVETGCGACIATPAMVLGITEAEWDRMVQVAEATGLGECHHCGLLQYKNHYRCVKCGSAAW